VNPKLPDQEAGNHAEQRKNSIVHECVTGKRRITEADLRQMA
jgi:hypothetical protein